MAGFPEVGEEEEEEDGEERDDEEVKSTHTQAPPVALTQAQATAMLALNSLELTDRGLLDLFAGLESWELDIFEVNDATGGRPLLPIALALFERYDFVGSFGLDRAVVCSFFAAVEAGYHWGNPFHNNIHAADVTQAVNHFFTYDSLGDFASEFDHMVSVVAAAIHDYDHPGRTNNFLIATKDTLALRYNDRSVLENHHLAKAFEILWTPGTDMFSQLDTEVQTEARGTIITMVLATDLKLHFEELALFRSRVLGPDAAGVDAEKLDDRRLVLKMALHAADLNASARRPQVARKWLPRIMREFFEQGDEEREMGLPISPFMDRFNPTVPKCQAGFIDFIVRPLFQAWVGFLHEFKGVALPYLDTNLELWKRLKEEEENELRPHLLYLDGSDFDWSPGQEEGRQYAGVGAGDAAADDAAREGDVVLDVGPGRS